MRKSKINILLILAIFAAVFIPSTVKAYEVVEFDEHEEDLVLLGSETKYLKTIIYYDNYSNVSNFFGAPSNPTSETYEITYEEYMNANPNTSYIINESHTIETQYRYITAYLYQNGNGYRYKNIVNWKTFPSVRSTDISGIGFFNSVTPNNLAFQQYYCSLSSGCGTSSFFLPMEFSEGVSSTFPLITVNDLYLLRSTFYVDVEKTNPNFTVTEQLSSADYSHAISTISIPQVLTNHSVLQNVAIILGSSISSYFDSQPQSSVYWSGSW